MKSQIQMFNDYTKELKRIPGVSMTEMMTKNGIVRIFSSTKPKSLPVTLIHHMNGGDFLMIEINGVDTCWWNTTEEENLDLFVETAIASLKGEVQFNLSPIFNRKEGCFRVQDGIWVCVPVNNVFTSFTIRKKLKHPITIKSNARK